MEESKSKPKQVIVVGPGPMSHAQELAIAEASEKGDYEILTPEEYKAKYHKIVEEIFAEKELRYMKLTNPYAELKALGSRSSKADLKRCLKGQHIYSEGKCIHCTKEIPV